MLEETGERQVKKNWIQVDADHRMRYEFAASLIADDAVVADIGCGIGYGSYFMAVATGCRSVLGIDIAQETVDYAKTFYAHPKVSYAKVDLFRQEGRIAQKFDLVTMFEVVEHVADAAAFLAAAADLLKDNGLLVLSTPNESVIPFQKEMFRFHQRHYTLDALEETVAAAGLEVIHRFSQNEGVIYGFSGSAMHIFVCRRCGAAIMPHDGAAVKDTLFHRMAECWERINWLLDHVPQKHVGPLALHWKRFCPEEESLWRELIFRRDAYCRKYAPRTCHDNPEFTGVLGPLEAGSEIVQMLPCDRDGLCAVSVLPALYQTSFNGLLTAAIYNETHKAVAIQTFCVLQDNQEIEMRFAPIEDSAGRVFQLELFVSELGRGSMLTFYATALRSGTTLYQNGQRLEKTLTYRLVYV